MTLVEALRRDLARDPGDAPAVDVQAAIDAAAPVVLPLGERGYPLRLISRADPVPFSSVR